MENFEKYLYLVLTAYFIVSTTGLWLTGYLLEWNPQGTVMLSAELIALPLLAWLVLSAYYLVRWVVKKRFQHQNSIKTAEKLT